MHKILYLLRPQILLVATVLVSACGGRAQVANPRPTATITLGSCGEPGRDGIMSSHPKIERADRDLDGDGKREIVVVDRKLCTAEENCYWNVFLPPRDGGCTHYAGTFAAALLELMQSSGDDNMVDVRGYWNLHGGRISLESYRFMRGGYQRIDALICRRARNDDRLECLDDSR